VIHNRKGHAMDILAAFFAGAFLCNAVPHLTSGLQGAPFPTPFARPHGVGLSSPLANFYWGVLNAAIGAALIAYHPVAVGPNADFAALLLGALILGTYSAHHFGKVRRNRAP
jgi:hypothetical protein